MYLCKNCNVISEQKPHYNSCNHCNNGNITEIKPKNITISEMRLNYDEGMILHYLPNISVTRDRYNRSGVMILTGRYVDHANIYRLGKLHNHMSEFLKLSRAEIDQLCIELYGKKNTGYAIHPVIIKSTIQDDYMIAPMSIQSIVDWHRDNNIMFEGIYYKKSIWSLEAMSRNEDYDNLKSIITADNTYTYYYNCMSSNNII